MALRPCPRGLCSLSSPALEQGQQLVGTAQPPEGDRAQLVAGGALGVVARDQVGDPLEQGVHPHGVAVGDASDDMTQPVLVGAGEGDIATAALRLHLGRVGRGVGLDDLGSGHVEHPAGRLGGDDRGHGSVDEADRRQRHRSRHARDLAGHPGLCLERLDAIPDERQPVLQVEHVGDDGLAGDRVDLADHGQLGDAELPHPRRTLTAHLDQPVRGPRAAAVGRPAGVGGVESRPMGRQPEIVDLSTSPAEEHLSDESQRRVGVKPRRVLGAGVVRRWEKEHGEDTISNMCSNHNLLLTVLEGGSARPLPERGPCWARAPRPTTCSSAAALTVMHLQRFDAAAWCAGSRG